MREHPATTEQYLTVAKLAHKLDVSPWTIRDWIKSGKLRAIKLGDNPRAAVRIKPSDVDALLVPFTPSSTRDSTSS